MKSHRRSFYARSLVFALGGAVALVSVVGCSALFLELPIGTESRSGAERSASAAPEPAPVDAVPSGELATTLLASLPIKGRAAKTGYDREDQFGTAWFDVDRNGCDTRNDVLARDLTATLTSGPCTVTSGDLADPYTATSIHFVRGNTTSTLVQIDHVVALMNAWQSGAQQLNAEQRIALANDPLNLLAVDGATNSAKGAGDAATWLPPNREFRCEYVARQITVKSTYGLWLTLAEHDAMARVLDTCPAQPAGNASALDTGGPGAPDTSAYYASCAAVRAAGAAPISSGQPGYSATLDGDDDGSACE